MTATKTVEAPVSYAGVFEFDTQEEKQIVGYTPATWDASTDARGHVTYKLVKAGDPIYAEELQVARVTNTIQDAYVAGRYGNPGWDNDNEWSDYTIWK